MTILQDTFTDTNGTLLSSHTSESGGTYTRHGSFTVATVTIEDNRAAKDTDAATAVYYIDNITDPKFPEVQFTIIDKSNVSRSTGIEVGMDTGSDTAIIFRRQNATTWQLLTIIAGTPSGNLLSASETFSAEAEHTLRLRRIPETNDYECFVDNVSLGLATITDAEFLGVGKIGIRATNSQGTGVGYHLDNLSVTALTAPRTLHRGRNFPLFDDEEVNRFEFWPAMASAADVPLTFSDDVDSLADSLATTLEHRVSFSGGISTLTDSEAHVLGVEASLGDSLDLLTDAHIELLTQLLSLADSPVANWDDAHQLLLAHLLEFSDDAANLSDSTLLNLEYRIPLTDDASTLTDGYAQQLNEVVGAIDLPLDDSFALTDSLSLGHGLVFTESAANFDDAESGELGQLTEFNDTLVLDDSLTLSATHLTSFNDALLLADSESITLGYDELLSDSLSLSDDQVQQLGQLLEFSDTIAISDSLALLLAHYSTLDDALSLTDSAAFLMTHALSLDDDANLLLDSLQTDTPQGSDILIGLTDAITLSDSIQLQLTYQFTLSDNAANWADSLTQTVTIALILSDNADTLTDAYAALMAHLLQAADALTLTDALATFGENYLQIDDSFTLSDDCDIDLRGPDVNLALDDSLILTDAITISLQDELQYQIVLSDTIVLYDHYFDLRHPYIPSAKRHIVVPSRARETRVPASDRETVPRGSRVTKVP